MELFKRLFIFLGMFLGMLFGLLLGAGFGLILTRINNWINPRSSSTIMMVCLPIGLIFGAVIFGPLLSRLFSWLVNR